ncbi:MAG TPA: site-specific integrase, partial [Ruminococcaceae bacterium]|nr:site-specific integrase [Oscillospiraceae bacterium]
MAKRRANGEGSIRKRKDGRWEGRYTAGHDPTTGKQIFKNVLAKTQAECREKLKLAIQTAGALDVAKAENMTVSAWMDLWMEHYGKPGMRPTTYANYETLIRLHIKPYIGDVILSKLTSLNLQKLYNKLLTEGRVDRPESKKQPKGLSAKTVRNIHTVIYSACEKAITERLVAANP